MDTSKFSIGIDISKATLDAFHLATGETACFENSPEGCAHLQSWICLSAPAEQNHIIFEATGRYHRTLERFFDQTAIVSTKVNPAHAKYFKKASGELSKTDRLDAYWLAKMGAAMDLAPSQVSAQVIETLGDFAQARQGLIADKIAIGNRMEALGNKKLSEMHTRRLAQVDAEIKMVDAEIADIVASDGDLKRRFEIMCSVPGMGPQTAVNLLAYLPELGSLNEKTVGGLSGLGPRVRQSGRWAGQAKIGGGRSVVRRAVYMAAWSATRHNPDLQQTYQALVGRGKPPKVALAAVMRKLLILLNALIRQDRIWENRAA